MSFLTAEWRKLVLANYEINPQILFPYLPNKTELDIYKDKCFVSLVGFMFKNTKLLGLKIPFHVNFEEVNLRFYVKHKAGQEWKRGVVFIKEIVPKAAITFIANTLYKEHYETLKMNHIWEQDQNGQLVSYQWKRNGIWQECSVKAEAKPQAILEGSDTEFITQHFWGYTKITDSKTYEYEVTHPRWEHYPVKDYNMKLDFGANYGPDFEFLNRQKPASVMLAEGSLITVENKRTI